MELKDWGGESYVFELEKTKVAEVGDSEVSGLDGDDELNQLHRLRPEQIHRGTAPCSSHCRCSLTPQLSLSRRRSEQKREREIWMKLIKSVYVRVFWLCVWAKWERESFERVLDSLVFGFGYYTHSHRLTTSTFHVFLFIYLVARTQ